MKKKSAYFSCFLLFFSSLGLADTCPSLSTCVGIGPGGTCNGWYVLDGPILSDNPFFQVISRNAYPFTTTCQYNSGHLSLVTLQQAAPVAPYLWSTKYIAGLTFWVCVSSLKNCSFTLIG